MKSNWPTLVLGALVMVMMIFITLDYFLFRHQGARFTAADGQALCERVQALESSPAPCEYGRPRTK